MDFRKSLFLLAIVGFIFLLPSCWNNSTGVKTGLVLVNVLDKELYDDCHIKGSINIPFDQLEDAANRIDKNAEVVCYCSNYMCGASSSARNKLIDMGYKKVYVYEAGTADWYQKGFPVGKNCRCQEGYLKGVIPAPDKKKEPYELTTQELKAKIDAFDTATKK